MRPDSTPAHLSWPSLADEAVVEIHAFLCDFLRLFEDHYGGQIHRFHQDRSYDSLVRDVAPPPVLTDDPPF